MTASLEHKEEDGASRKRSWRVKTKKKKKKKRQRVDFLISEKKADPDFDPNNFHLC